MSVSYWKNLSEPSKSLCNIDVDIVRGMLDKAEEQINKYVEQLIKSKQQRNIDYELSYSKKSWLGRLIFDKPKIFDEDLFRKTVFFQEKSRIRALREAVNVADVMVLSVEDVAFLQNPRLVLCP